MHRVRVRVKVSHRVRIMLPPVTTVIASQGPPDRTDGTYREGQLVSTEDSLGDGGR